MSGSSVWWSRFHSAIRASRCELSAASNVAASRWPSRIRQVGGVLVAGLGDRRLGVGAGRGGSGFEFDRGAQLADRGVPRQLRVVLIRTVGGPRGDDADLIQRQPALPQTGNAAGKLADPVRDSSDGVRVGRRGTQLPGDQRRQRAAPGVPPQPVVDLGGDLHNAPVDRVALTGQLRELLEQHLEALIDNVFPAAGVRRRCHNTIKALGYDMFWCVARGVGQPEGGSIGIRLIGTQWVPGPSPGQPAPSTTRVRSPKKLPSGFGIQ